MKNYYSLIFAVLSFAFVFTTASEAAAQTSPPSIKTDLAVGKTIGGKGATRLAQGSLTISIPAGYHVNAHNPLSSYAVPTTLELFLPRGVKVKSISYPRAIAKTFSFSEEKLGVYERRAVIRFTLTVPANASGGAVRARLNYQSCSDQVCFPPARREATATLAAR